MNISYEDEDLRRYMVPINDRFNCDLCSWEINPYQIPDFMVAHYRDIDGFFIYHMVHDICYDWVLSIDISKHNESRYDWHQRIFWEFNERTINVITRRELYTR